MRFEEVQRFILAKKIFWRWDHFKSLNANFLEANYLCKVTHGTEIKSNNA